jgi:hypothetical protein
MTDQTHESDLTDDEFADDAIDEIETSVWTAEECADELNVTGKAFRSFMRAYSRANGLATPGSGGRWAIDVPTDDAMRLAFFDAMREAYRSHARTNNSVRFVLKRD